MRIALRFFEDRDGLILEPDSCQLLGVLLRLPGIDELPDHQPIFLAHLAIGVLSPLTMDSRIPGMDRR